MQHAYIALYVHLVFAVEQRRRLLVGDLGRRTHAYLATVARNLHVDVLTVGGVEDHVHLALAIRSDLQISSLVRDLKSNSSRFVAQQSGRHFAWQRGYSVFSVSPSSLPAVVQYIDRQEEHHKRHSTIEELATLMRRYRARES